MVVYEVVSVVLVIVKSTLRRVAFSFEKNCTIAVVWFVLLKVFETVSRSGGGV